MALGVVVRRLLDRQWEISSRAAIQRDHARFLHAASEVLASGGRVEEALQEVLDGTLGILGDAALLQGLEAPEGSESRLALAAGSDPRRRLDLARFAREHPLVPGHGFAGEAAATGDARLLRDAVRERHGLAMPLAGVHSALAVPLKAGGRPLGVLTFFCCRHGEELGPDHVRLAILLADRAALAIEHARLYRELEALVEYRTARLHEAQQQLVEAERASELAGTLAHEIRNPLNVARTAAFALRQRLGTEDPRVERHLSALVRNVDAAARLIQDLVDYGAVPPPELGLADLRAVAEDVRGELLPSEGVQPRFQLPAQPVHACFDQSQIRRAVKTLVRGVMELAAPDGEVALEVRHEAGQAMLVVCHTGAPLPDPDQDRLFDPLFRSGAGRTGVAFALTRRIAEENGGSIRLAESDRLGRTFVLRLPLAQLPTDGDPCPDAGGVAPDSDQVAGVDLRTEPQGRSGDPSPPPPFS